MWLKVTRDLGISFCIYRYERLVLIIFAGILVSKI
jgi:hypothetical protein